MTSAFRSLRHRNYRLFFVGQGISLIGTWMQQIAMSWLVYQLSKSALLLGVVGFAGQIPTFLLSPFAGVMADRWNKRRVLVITQTLSMLQAFALAALVLMKAILVWHIIALGILLGCVNAFDITTRQAFVPEMLEKKEDLGNAIALNSSLFNAARLIGPAIAGILIAIVGEGMCFLVNGISYIAVIIALLMMKLERAPRRAASESFRNEITQGFSYVYNSVAMKSILLLLALVSFVGVPYAVLMPIFAGSILHGGAHTLGFLMTASGLGALGGTIFLASRKGAMRLGMTTPVSGMVFGAGLMVFAYSRFLWLSLLLMAVTGFGIIVQMASSNMVLQYIVDDGKRGRVMSFFAMAFMGTAPFGSLLAGALAGRIGAPATLLLCGIGCVLGSLAFSSRLPLIQRELAPIYVQKEII
ncbi:MAG: MFS transporter [Actinomycetota bacterium]|nr:MFS transporter [Actinomycetota bacterium]